MPKRNHVKRLVCETITVKQLNEIPKTTAKFSPKAKRINKKNIQKIIKIKKRSTLFGNVVLLII